jgi:hypothetical protein
MPNSDAERARAEIRPIKRRVEHELLARPEITAVDIAHKRKKGKKTDQMSIVISVKKKKAKGSLKSGELIPAEIDGIPTDVIEDEIVPQPALTQVEAQIDASTYSTLQGGISMGPCRSVYLTPPAVEKAGNYVFVGTLGVFVRDRTSHDVMTLTNFHVACIDTGWKVGDAMTQPGRVDGGVCPGGQFGTLERAVLSEHVDGSLVRLAAGKSWTCSIAEIGDVHGQGTAANGMAVRKRGRTTGLTYGKVGSVDYSTSIDYGDGIGTRILKNQIRVDVDTSRSTQFGDHGDSGSVVVDDSNNIIGLHFAGNTSGSLGVANPIQFVLDELNVELCSSIVPLVTRPTICGPLRTRPEICDVVVTRPTVCGAVTTPIVCTVRTRPIACSIKTTPILCRPVATTPGPCPIVSRGCPGPDPGPFVPPDIRFSEPAEVYGTPDAAQADSSYWQGYAAALEAVSEAEGEAKAE